MSGGPAPDPPAGSPVAAPPGEPSDAPSDTPVESVDVLIVGAGLSGIGAAVHLQRRCSGHRVLMVEARDRPGGTWDLFRYPGVRSDSDMHTLGYAFRPWTGTRSIAEGGAILDYLLQTLREHGLERQLRLGLKVLSADWSSQDAGWTVTLRRSADGQRLQMRCSFLYLCHGYYDHAAGYQPDFPGRETFGGTWVHPQHWPQGLAVQGRRIVVIGSGATAVTLVPALARQGAQVTLLQRSPTWIVSRPSVDPLGRALARVLPASAVSRLLRWKNLWLSRLVYRTSRRDPQRLRRLLLAGVRQALGPAATPEVLARDFTPRYDPWDQRLCLVPDGDLFEVLRDGRAQIVTEAIDRVEPQGLRLASGRVLEADIVVSATGLVLRLSPIPLRVDGRAIDPAQTVGYKGVMSAGVPNLATTFGYVNASWTLKADLTAVYVCRLLRHMRRQGWRVCRPAEPPADEPRLPVMPLSSGYVQRALDELPRQGRRAPWKLNQDVIADQWALRWRPVDDGTLHFSR